MSGNYQVSGETTRLKPSGFLSRYLPESPLLFEAKITR